jgi:hypothetical protein
LSSGAVHCITRVGLHELESADPKKRKEERKEGRKGLQLLGIPSIDSRSIFGYNIQLTNMIMPFLINSPNFSGL